MHNRVISTRSYVCAGQSDLERRIHRNCQERVHYVVCKRKEESAQETEIQVYDGTIQWAKRSILGNTDVDLTNRPLTTMGIDVLPQICQQCRSKSQKPVGLVSRAS